MATTDPYTLLLKLYSARNVGAIERLLKERALEITMLSESERTAVEKIEADSAIWRKIEDEHGPGAVLDLSDPLTLTVARLRGHVRLLSDEHFDNAERFTASFGTPEGYRTRLQS